MKNIDVDTINALKFLSIDGVQAANSGHPGMPLGMAELASVLWLNYLKFNPKDPKWFNRDRFILSNGHGSMLHYSLLHLTGYDLAIAELKNFRKLHSKTPGHPEYGLTPGVETTTGPLGQGLANGVGMALAEKLLAAEFNRPNFNIIDHKCFVFLGDGCLMEGVSHESCSLAGRWGLEKLICIYDSNGISIDGIISDWYADDTALRFKSYNWNVIGPIDGHNQQEIDQAISKATKLNGKPTLIIANTVIGRGSPNKQGTAAVHGSALGDDEIALMRKTLNWQHPAFEIPEDIYKKWRANEHNLQKFSAENDLFAEYKIKYKELAVQLEARLNGKINSKFLDSFPEYVKKLTASKAPMASRKASLLTLNSIAPDLPELLGGSADLTESNLTKWEKSKDLSAPDFIGNYIHYGVREFGMLAIINGVNLHGGFRAFGGTFLTFMDYCKSAIRMAAIMNIGTIAVFTHDSIGLGEDGPTHQAVEHLASARLIPNLDVWRPADQLECLYAWRQAIINTKPTAIMLSRQELKAVYTNLNINEIYHQDILKGAYLVQNPNGAKLTFIATGSEVSIVLDVAAELKNKHGIDCRIVSMPSTTCFESQNLEFKNRILGNLKIIVVEAGSTANWYSIIRDRGIVLGVDAFGESAPYKDVYKKFALDVPSIVSKALDFIN